MLAWKNGQMSGLKLYKALFPIFAHLKKNYKKVSLAIFEKKIKIEKDPVARGKILFDLKKVSKKLNFLKIHCFDDVIMQFQKVLNEPVELI